jgi:3-hydroxyacyl-CoA dehydrogenase
MGKGMKESVSKIAGIGARMIGHGIAQSFAQADPISMMKRTRYQAD